MTKTYLTLKRDFFIKDTIYVAKSLLGKILLRHTNKYILTGRIVEVEAYLGEHDPAAHASAGKTNRTHIMYEKPGHAYIFRIHQQHCLNVVTEPVNHPGCVLIRAIEPLIGLEKMKQQRENTLLKETAIANGPGKLCKAFHITMSLYGIDLTDTTSPLQICENVINQPFEIATSPRIGINKAADWLLRFYIKDNAFVS